MEPSKGWDGAFKSVTFLGDISALSAPLGLSNQERRRRGSAPRLLRRVLSVDFARILLKLNLIPVHRRIGRHWIAGQ